MIRSIVIMNIPSMNELPAMERWYTRYHAPEILHRFGPWLTRLESYRVVPVPPEAERYGYYNYRVTESWWRSVQELPSVCGTLSFTPSPIRPKVVSIFVPPQPTEDFMGGEVTPDEKTILRWYIVFKYPDEVPVQEGEDWFLNIHAREVMQQPGLTRFFSYRASEIASLPGHRPSKGPPPTAWHRLSEQWYENFDGWRKSVINSPRKYTKPPWGKYDQYPFLEPYVDFVSTFILERPTDDFLRDWRGYI